MCLLTVTVYQGTNDQPSVCSHPFPALDGRTGETPGVVNSTGFARVNMNTKLLNFYGEHVGVHIGLGSFGAQWGVLPLTELCCPRQRTLQT